MRAPSGIHPRKPWCSLRMTEGEARDLMKLLDGVDRKGGIACGMHQQISNYDRIAHRLRKARLHAPRRRV